MPSSHSKLSTDERIHITGNCKFGIANNRKSCAAAKTQNIELKHVLWCMRALKDKVPCSHGHAHTNVCHCARGGRSLCAMLEKYIFFLTKIYTRLLVQKNVFTYTTTHTRTRTKPFKPDCTWHIYQHYLGYMQQYERNVAVLRPSAIPSRYVFYWLESHLHRGTGAREHTASDLEHLALTISSLGRRCLRTRAKRCVPHCHTHTRIHFLDTMRCHEPSSSRQEHHR